MRINYPGDAYDILENISRRKRENFGVILLDTQRNVIGKSVMFKGTINNCLVGKREILVYALKKDAVGIMLFHNHPTGDTTPSKEDIETTNEIRKGCESVGLRLVDHIIVGKNGYSSFHELKLLEKEEEILKVAE